MKTHSLPFVVGNSFGVVPCQLAKYNGQTDRPEEKSNNSLFLPLLLKRTRDDACPIPFCQLAKKTVCHVVCMQSGFALHGCFFHRVKIGFVYLQIHRTSGDEPVASSAKSATTQDDMARITRVLSFLPLFLCPGNPLVHLQHVPSLRRGLEWGCG